MLGRANPTEQDINERQSQRARRIDEVLHLKPQTSQGNYVRENTEDHREPQWTWLNQRKSRASPRRNHSTRETGPDLHAESYCDWVLSLMNSSVLLVGLDFGPILAGRHFCCRCWCFLLALDQWVRCSCPLLLDDGKLGVPLCLDVNV
ncbi:hypothetical protein Nepgr_002643 [Nepenthes gracilis]|uniref:Uncharacterized protein n=1 Tax=Nepenthes gracilis TaxID=150966 RepID=A0AAD3P9W1_NEPGR|nr:hypothetical protein Nepgr_002643 [Nepenthes gracilis]